MNSRTIASLVAAGRIGAGLDLTFAPKLVTRSLAGRRGLPRSGVAATSVLAASGVVLGLWAVRGLDQAVP